MSENKKVSSVDTVKNNVIAAITKKFVKNLQEEVGNTVVFGSIIGDPNLNQHTLWVESTMEQICHIRPTKPKFAPGTLLSSPDGIQTEEDQSGLMKCSGIDSDFNVSIDIGIVKDIEELGTTRRYLVSETIMVTDESIQIRKLNTLKSSDSIQKTGLVQSCVYSIRHLVHALDNKRKVFIPTKMFRENNSRWSADLIMVEELDVELIEKIYNGADPEEIVSPLKIFK